jgi:hypothetical protein
MIAGIGSGTITGITTEGGIKLDASTGPPAITAEGVTDGRFVAAGSIFTTAGVVAARVAKSEAKSRLMARVAVVSIAGIFTIPARAALS